MKICFPIKVLCSTPIILVTLAITHTVIAHAQQATAENITSAEIIENGFQMLINNGEFDLLFNANFGVSLAKLDLNQRKVFELKNPYF